MATTSHQLTLQLQRIVPAPPPVVMRAHVDAQVLAQWWGPTGFTAPSIELDLSVGGSYRIAMQPPDGALFYLSGEFVEVDLPRTLAYTFRWEDPDPDDRETVVHFALEDCGESSALRLHQGVFATERRRALHVNGWSESFDRLHKLLSGQAPPVKEGSHLTRPGPSEVQQCD